MFQGITLLDREAVDGQLRTTFDLKDTCFTQEVSVVSSRDVFLEDGFSLEPVAIFRAYTDRRLNVVRNLAIYYATLESGARYLLSDGALIDKHFSSLEYGKKYHRLVKIDFDELKKLIAIYDKQESIYKQMLRDLNSK